MLGINLGTFVCQVDTLRRSYSHSPPQQIKRIYSRVPIIQPLVICHFILSNIAICWRCPPPYDGEGSLTKLPRQKTLDPAGGGSQVVLLRDLQEAQSSPLGNFVEWDGLSLALCCFQLLQAWNETIPLSQLHMAFLPFVLYYPTLSLIHLPISPVW